MELNEIIRLIEIAKTSGLTSLELNGLKLRFKKSHGNVGQEKIPASEKKIVPDVKVEEIITPASVLDEMTAEEILFYATPYYDELQAKKEELKKHAEGIV